MSSLIANAPTRRLLCRACLQTQKVTLCNAPAQGVALDKYAIHRREYAQMVKVRRRVVKPTAMPSTARASDGSKLLFTPGHVPPPAEWMDSLQSLNDKELTAMECVNAAQRYVAVATPEESKWRGDLETKHDLPPYLLHIVGCALIASNSQMRWRLGTHMMRSASHLGYMPSTLTLLRVFTSMSDQMLEKASSSAIYQQALALFHANLQSQNPDPNAFTLQGILEAKKGTAKADANAMQMFSQAAKAWQKANSQNTSSSQETAPLPDETSSKVPNAAADQGYTLPMPREPRWEWEVSNVLGQAKILLKYPTMAKQALKKLRVLALELDNPFGFLMLAKLMDGPRDTPERRTYWIKAAISGEEEACLELGQLEKSAAANATDPKEKADHTLLSDEWFRLGTGEDLSAGVKKADIDDDEVAE